MLVKKKAAVTLVTPLIQGCEVCQRIFRPVCASDGVIFIIIDDANADDILSTYKC